MFLYWIESEHRFVHRKDEVPKGLPIDKQDIPTDTAGLMGYLNNLWRLISEKQPVEVVETPKEFTGPDGSKITVVDQTVIEPVVEKAPVLVKQPDIAPDLNVEEAIQNANPVQLASYASNVCWRIKELSDGRLAS